MGFHSSLHILRFCGSSSIWIVIHGIVAVFPTSLISWRLFSFHLAWAVSIPMIRTLAKVTVLSWLFQPLPPLKVLVCVSQYLLKAGTSFSRSHSPSAKWQAVFACEHKQMVYLSKQVPVMHAFYKISWKNTLCCSVWALLKVGIHLAYWEGQPRADLARPGKICCTMISPTPPKVLCPLCEWLWCVLSFLLAPCRLALMYPTTHGFVFCFLVRSVKHIGILTMGRFWNCHPLNDRIFHHHS